MTTTKVKELFQKYNQISDRKLEYFLQMLEAERNGNNIVANYLKNHILPNHTKKSYKAFCEYHEAFQQSRK